VLFSAAPPGQGGEYHVNERPYAYWRKLFHERDYVMFDAIRPSVSGRADVAYWYRFNTFLYVHRSRTSLLPEQVARYEIPIDRPIPDIAPASMKFWRLLTRPMPVWYVTFIARRIVKPMVVRQHRQAAARTRADSGHE